MFSLVTLYFQLLKNLMSVVIIFIVIDSLFREEYFLPIAMLSCNNTSSIFAGLTPSIALVQFPEDQQEQDIIQPQGADRV